MVGALNRWGWSFILSFTLWFSITWSQDLSSGKISVVTPDILDKAKAFSRGIENRFHGSRGNDEAVKRLKQTFAQYKNVESGSIRYEQGVFKPGKASLTWQGKTIPIHPMYPTIVELSNLPPKLETEIVYLGNGDLKNAKGLDLKGKLVLLDFNSRRNFYDLMVFGIEGFIFIEPSEQEADFVLAAEKLVMRPVTLPRYEIAHEQGLTLKAALLKNPKNSQKVVVTSEPNQWVNKDLESLWAYIPGAHPEKKKEIVILKTQFDNFHLVPEKTSGGVDTLNFFLTFELFKKYAANPSRYSLLFHFHNSSIQNHSGAAHLIHATLSPRGEKEVIFNNDLNKENEELVLEETIAIAEYHKEQYKEYSPELITQEKIDELKDLVGNPIGNVNIKTLQSFIRKVDYDLFQFEKEKSKLRNKEGGEKRIQEIQDRVNAIGEVVKIFKKFNKGMPIDQMTPEGKAVFEYYRQKVLKEADLQIERSNELKERLSDLKKLRDLLEGKEILVALGSELTYGHRHVGLYSSLYWYRYNEMGNTAMKNSTFPNRVEAQLEEGLLKEVPALKWQVDDGLDIAHQISDNNNMYIRFNVPSYDFSNPYDRVKYKWTKYDRLESLDAGIVYDLARVYEEGVEAILGSDTISKDLPEKSGERFISQDVTSISGYYETRIKDGSTIGEPETILEEGLIVAFDRPWHYRLDNGELYQYGGTLPWRLTFSDKTGRALFRSIPAVNSRSKVRIEVFKFDQNHKIVMALDQGTSTRKREYRIVQPETFLERHLLAGVEIGKADLYHLVDPGSLKALDTIEPMGAQGGYIQDYNIFGAHAFNLPSFEVYYNQKPVVLFAPDDQPMRLKFNRGRAFLANIAGDDPDKDPGYYLKDLDRQSVSELLAIDARRINEIRTSKLEGFSIKNSLVNDLIDKSSGLFEGKKEKASIKKVANDAYASQNNARLAMGSSYIAYPLVKSIIVDLVKAVVFYMVIMLPFSFFIMKLLFDLKKLEHQLMAVSAIFFGTYILFYFIHPAFQIARNPQLIILSFVTVVLVLFVLGVLRGKFDLHMKRIGGKIFGGENNVVKLAGKAFLVGVSNMRRRKMRTSLTCLTIIFITFTMLSFTSVSQNAQPTKVLLEETSPYDGVYIADEVWASLPPVVVDTMESLVGEDNVVTRSFVSASFDYREVRIILHWPEENRKHHQPKKNTTNTNFLKNGTLKLQAVLGLSEKEDGLIEKMDLVNGRYFVEGETHKAIISDKMALEKFGIDPKSHDFTKEPLLIRVDGVRLEIVGFVDSEKMRNKKDLRGDSILPPVLQNMNLDDDTLFSMSSFGVGSLRPVNYDEYIIVNEDTPGLRLEKKSLSVKLPDSDSVWQKVIHLVRHSELRFYFGAKNDFRINPEGDRVIREKKGTYFLRSGFETSIGGLAALLVPLLVSATIIFNTMLSAVYERKKEIAVYNSIGLNPVHIGLFFIAESVVYGIVGSVAGYLIGQVFAKVIQAMNWFQDLNINYSSTSVVFAILFTIAIVILSSLYPAYVAMKTAVTSSGVERPDVEGGDTITLTFPFSFTAEKILAVHAYIREYMELHADQSVGGFMATEMGDPSVEGEQDQQKISYIYSVSLAPFDLGVRQEVEFKSEYNSRVGAFMFTSMTVRKSGTDSNWMATNRPFTDGLRKYLLHWRALKPSEQDQFYQLACETLKIQSTKGVEA